MECMAVPPKYREMADFHEYYNGLRKAPFLTIFIGGNHEASNHSLELFYGGWVAPSIYYMGAAGVVRCGSLRIAGLSGIWKGYDYKKPRYERFPFNSDDVKSVYHIREFDVERLRHIRTQVDIGLSHDWPRGVEWEGDSRALFKMKPLFESDARSNDLGSPVTRDLLDHLRPSYWFSAHLHCKYAAVIDHQRPEVPQLKDPDNSMLALVSPDKGMREHPESVAPSVANENTKKIELTYGDISANVSIIDSSSYNDHDVRQQLPASFTKAAASVATPIPTSIHNKSTRFLALDKCLPGRQFLQLIELEPINAPASEEVDCPSILTYDKEWLALNRVFSNHLGLGPTQPVNRSEIDATYMDLISAAETWVEVNLVKQGRMVIPHNFEKHQAQQLLSQPSRGSEQTTTFFNPQTAEFCDMLGIPLPFPPGSFEQESVRDSTNGRDTYRVPMGHQFRTQGRSGSWRRHRGRGG